MKSEPPTCHTPSLMEVEVLLYNCHQHISEASLCPHIHTPYQSMPEKDTRATFKQVHTYSFIIISLPLPDVVAKCSKHWSTEHDFG